MSNGILTGSSNPILFTNSAIGQSLTWNSQASTVGTIVIGSNGALSVNSTPNTKVTAKRIGPKLFFSYVKSKLNKSQQKKLKARLGKLQQLVKQAEELNQQALFEELSKSLVLAVRESEAVACGYDTWLKQADVAKFMSMVRENDTANSSPVFFKKLEEFPRAIPANVKKALKAAQSKGIFDEFWILYLDYTREEVKTNKEKIRQKDPILFGRHSNDGEKLYFIIDWIDEYCDLTLSKFVEKMKTVDPEYDVTKVEEIDQAYIDRIKLEVQDRADRLAGTHSQNYRDRMAEEERLVRDRQAINAAAAADKVERERRDLKAKWDTENKIRIEEERAKAQEAASRAKRWWKFW